MNPLQLIGMLQKAQNPMTILPGKKLPDFVLY